MNKFGYRSIIIAVGFAAIVGLVAASPEAGSDPAAAKPKAFESLMHHVNNFKGQATKWGGLGFDMSKHYIGHGVNQAKNIYQQRLAKRGAAKPEAEHVEENSRDISDGIEQAAEDIEKPVEEAAEEKVEEAAENVEEAGDKVEDVVENVEEAVEHPVAAAAEEVAEKAEEVAKEDKKED